MAAPSSVGLGARSIRPAVDTVAWRTVGSCRPGSVDRRRGQLVTPGPERHGHVPDPGVLVGPHPLDGPVEREVRRSESSTSSSMTRISSRARLAPRQKWVRWPKVRWGLGARRMSKRNGSSKTASSRLADGHHSVTLSPAAMVVPAQLGWHRVAVRRL